jgi:hypothetical protein
VGIDGERWRGVTGLIGVIGLIGVNGVNGVTRPTVTVGGRAHHD